MISFPKNEIIRHVFVSWFILAVLALAFSGIYSFFPYALRTPALAKILNMASLFNVSLMIHVNLGVLVWFLSSSAMLMTLVIKEKFMVISFVSFISSMTGTIFIIASPFIGDSEPVKNNYIPILHNLTFILGVSLFLSGILLQSLLTLLSFKQIKKNSFNLVIYISAMIFMVAVICFITSTIELNIIAKNRFIDLFEYYELLFWGAGHILQFNYVQLVIYAWMIVALKLIPDLKFNIKLFSISQWLNFILVVSVIPFYWIYSLDSAELNLFFTNHMKHVGGILTSIIALWLFFKMIYKNGFQFIKRFELISFLCSLFLIGSGGIIGYLITGSNVTIPAHYHGVILGITVGLMGLFYILLPQMGFREVNNKQAIWQLLLYSLGQFIHILALAISGGYGVLRKDPNTELTTKAKIFMGAMGIGGTIALIGGILFVILIFKNMKRVEAKYETN